MFKKILAGSLLLASTASQAVDNLGIQIYQSFSQSVPDTALETFAGDSVAYYHNPANVTLNNNEIEALVGWLDTSMSLYRRFGRSDFPVPGRDCANGRVYDNVGSVSVIASAPGLPAGLGCNGKSEVYVGFWNENFFENHPTDVRTWEIAYYELGRGVSWSFTDYFVFQDEYIAEAFPRFVSWQTMTENGIDPIESVGDPVWGNTNVSPAIFDIRLQQILQSNDFIDFWSAPNFTINNFPINDAYAVLFYDLHDTYGSGFMEEFFSFARENNSTMVPTSATQALCNIVRAGNVALNRIGNTGPNQNVVGNYLRTEFDFPNCSDPVDIKLTASTKKVAKNLKTVISWDAWGAVPSNAEYQLYVDYGTGWKSAGSFGLGVNSTEYLVPSSASKFSAFVGITQNGQWIKTHSKTYTLTDQPSLTLIGRPSLSNVGRARINWISEYDLANTEIQVFAASGSGWQFVESTDNQTQTSYIPINDDADNVSVFIGYTSKARWVKTTSKRYDVDDEL